MSLVWLVEVLDSLHLRHALSSVVVRAVVNDNDLFRRVRLSLRALYCFADTRGAVERRNDDRNEPSNHVCRQCSKACEQIPRPDLWELVRGSGTLPAGPSLAARHAVPTHLRAPRRESLHKAQREIQSHDPQLTPHYLPLWSQRLAGHTSSPRLVPAAFLPRAMPERARGDFSKWRPRRLCDLRTRRFEYRV